MIEIKSQFKTRQRPRVAPQTPAEPKQPGIWESFRGGLNSGLGFRHEDWLDLRLSPQQWLDKYPDKTIHDWKDWKQKLENKLNWLQRAFQFKIW